MENQNMRIYKHHDKEVRVIEEEGANFVCVADLAKIMGLADGRITRIPYPCRQIMVNTKGGIQPVKMMRIDNVVTLLFRSRKPGAEDVRRWFMAEIAKEHLPS